LPNDKQLEELTQTAQRLFRSRIVGHVEMDPNELLANPFNWRIHPQYQREALEGVLSEVGWVDEVKVNHNNGHVVDGHLRVSLALSHDEPLVPVMLLDLTEEEEKIILATIDPIASMAVTDAEKLGELFGDIQADTGRLAETMQEIAANNAPKAWADVFSAAGGDAPEYRHTTFSLRASQWEVVKRAVDAAKPYLTEADLEVNKNKNGSAIYLICEAYLNGLS
jgi:hypothetical protein